MHGETRRRSGTHRWCDEFAQVPEDTRGRGWRIDERLRTGDALAGPIRFGRMPKGDVCGLCRALVRDVTAMRAQRSALKVAHVDGRLIP